MNDDTPHYWSMEHYGFDDDPGGPAPAPRRAHEPSAAPRTPRIGRGRRLTVAVGAVLAVLFTGTGAYAAVHAAQGTQQPAAVQQDGPGPHGSGAPAADPLAGDRRGGGRR
jgi:hypothetical protein